jgi:flavodoxin
VNTLIVYDSVFGNTEKIAQAMQKSLASQGKVEMFRAADAKPEHLIGVGLLIVGSPTRAFRATPSVTQFINNIPLGALKGIKVASFDTRVSTIDINSRFLKVLAKVFGYAAKPIADNLVKKGGTLITQPEGFYVKDSEGPLKDGELERAGNWALLAREWGEK